MKEKIVIGWRETLALPSLGIHQINAKIDTGARTSCLHAFKVERFEKCGNQWARFWIHPIQNDLDTVVVCEAKIIDQRSVRDSGGHEEQRYVIEADVQLGDRTWSAEFTLTNRENMKFRMLLGRTAMQEHLLVDSSLSYTIAFKESK